MDQPADFGLERGEGGVCRLVLRGDWTSQGMGRAGSRLAGAVRARSLMGKCALELSGLGRLDTAGAFALAREAGVTPKTQGLADREDARRLVAFVTEALIARGPERRRRTSALYALLVRAGEGVYRLAAELVHTFIFYGRLISATGNLLARPTRIRAAPTVSLMERAGLDALPIIAATNFFVGATMGFLGEDLLTQFGAQIFSVELIGIGVLREFAVLITAVILAGRSASSFAAELGAMKMNQEVDAMEVMGVNPFEALVLPRFIAMLLMTPLLTFVAMMAGLLGGLVVIWATIGLSPAFFLQRLLDNVGVTHFYIGIVKSPVMAMVIASIGCRQGLEVGGDVEQLGRRVTSAVVQALFSIIIIDAIFALLFMEIGV